MAEINRFALTSLGRTAGSGDPIVAARSKIAPYEFAVILRALPTQRRVQDVRLRPWRSTRCLCSDAMLAPPRVVAVGSSRAGASGRFPGVVALLDACGLIRRTPCIVDPRNTLLPQCKIVGGKEQTEKHQALSDSAKNYFRYSRACRRTVSRLFG